MSDQLKHLREVLGDRLSENSPLPGTVLPASVGRLQVWSLLQPHLSWLNWLL